LELRWHGEWKDFMVRLDGKPLNGALSREELEAGREIPLDDGTTIRVHLARGVLLPRLKVSRNGQPLFSRHRHPKTIVSYTYKFIFLFAVVNLVAGLVGVFVTGESPVGPSLALGWPQVAVGVAFLILGVLVWQRSLLALAITVVLLAADMLLAGFFLVVSDERRIPLLVGLILRLVILLYMSQGFSAIRTLRKLPP
jgi:hypothetical protein